MNTFAKNLKKARQASGRTQVELADHFGVTRGAVAQWESGMIYPEGSKLAELAEFLDVSLDHLFRAEGDQPGDVKEELPKLAKFWMVYGVGQRSPTCRHWSEDSAKNEALRLAKQHPGIEFVVLEATSAVASKPLIIEFEVAVGDDLPF